MLRVAYVFERFPSFGQTFCYREVEELVRQGADVSVFSIRRPAGEPPEAWDQEIVRRVTYLPEEGELVKEVERASRAGELPPAATEAIREWDRRSDFLRLYQAAFVGLRLRRAGIERVHAHFAGMAARTAYWIRQFFAIEYSVTAHANDIFAPREFAVSLTKIFDAAHAVVTVSDFAVDQLRQQFSDNAGKFHRVYNGIDVGRFTVASLNAEVPLILSVGRLIEKKGFDDLIRACAILQKCGVAFRCDIVGEGPLESALRAQIEETGLGTFVHLIGPQTQRQIADRLAEATLFVLPCRKNAKGDMDNLPTVIMEAMAAGLPVISTALAGIREMVQSGVTGELSPPGNAEALADAIEGLVRDSIRAREYGVRGRELAETKFSITRNVSALATILAQRASLQ
jgi:colanic acid/amylovoran biosynthesis glycosyltransferase